MNLSLRRWIWIVVCVIGIWYNSLCQAEESMPVKPLAHDYVFISDERLESLHPFRQAIVRWPGDEQIAESEKMVDEKSAEAAIKQTMDWLKKILREEWIPEASQVKIHPLKGYVEGADATYLRYQRGGYAVQVVQTCWCVDIIIKDQEASSNNFTMSDAKHYVASIIDLFFNYSDEIKRISMTKIKEHEKWFYCNPDLEHDSSAYWWGLMSWWTDGNVIIFSTGKADGGPLEPTYRAEWFLLKGQKEGLNLSGEER